MGNNLTGGAAADMVSVKTPWVAPVVVETDIEAITMASNGASVGDTNTRSS